MKLSFTKRILISVLMLCFSFSLTFNALAQLDTVKNSVDKTAQATGFKQQNFVPAWNNYINGLLTLMGLLFMIFAIYGGWLWMTAQGKEEQVSRAKKMIIGATIGLGIVLTARIIVELVIRNIPG